MTNGRTIALRDGTPVLVRTIRPADADALDRFHESHSPETTRLRFFTVHPHLSAEEVCWFTTCDGVARDAVVVFHGGDIVAVGRYDRVPGTTSAEVAFVVGDAWRRRGIATLLFDELVVLATGHGIDEFVAETLAENHAMLRVFAKTGLVTGQRIDSGVYELRMPLTGTRAPEPAH